MCDCLFLCPLAPLAATFSLQNLFHESLIKVKSYHLNSLSCLFLLVLCRQGAGVPGSSYREWPCIHQQWLADKVGFTSPHTSNSTSLFSFLPRVGKCFFMLPICTISCAARHLCQNHIQDSRAGLVVCMCLLPCMEIELLQFSTVLVFVPGPYSLVVSPLEFHIHCS
jgi:hypothetical protein